jgi:hypothetical protein
MRAFMLMKQEAFHITFGSASTMPPPYSVGSALSTSSVTSTPIGHSPLEPNTPVTHAPSLGAHARTGGTLSWLGDLRPTSSGLAGLAIDLNRTSSIGDTTPTCMKKPRRISTAGMPRAVKLFDNMTEQALVPTEEVIAHPTYQLSLPVGSSAGQKLVMADARAGFHGERWRGHHA